MRLRSGRTLLSLLSDRPTRPWISGSRVRGAVRAVCFADGWADSDLEFSMPVGPIGCSCWGLDFRRRTCIWARGFRTGRVLTEWRVSGSKTAGRAGWTIGWPAVGPMTWSHSARVEMTYLSSAGERPQVGRELRGTDGRLGVPWEAAGKGP